MDWKRVVCVQPTAARSGCTGLSGAADESKVSRPRQSRRSREKFNGVRLKFTGLSGGAPD
jgi:hypothetical protein